MLRLHYDRVSGQGGECSLHTQGFSGEVMVFASSMVAFPYGCYGFPYAPVRIHLNLDITTHI